MLISGIEFPNIGNDSHFSSLGLPRLTWCITGKNGSHEFLGLVRVVRMGDREPIPAGTEIACVWCKLEYVDTWLIVH